MGETMIKETDVIMCQWPVGYLTSLPKECEDNIKKALEHSYGELTMKEIASDLLEGVRQIWLMTKGDKVVGTFLTKVSETDQKRICEITHAGGKGVIKYRDFLFETFTKWAKDNQCTDITIIGRDGWSRLYEPYGFEKRYTIIGISL